MAERRAPTGRVCTRCVLPEHYPHLTFDKEGVCSVCRQHELQWKNWDEQLAGKERLLRQLCEDARRKNKEFDVLVPLSGGKDSMYVLYYTVKKLDMKCLSFTLDNGYLTPHARVNIDRACRILGVEHIYYRLDPNLVNELFGLFMRKTGYFCSVCLRAIGMATDLIADSYDIPLVFGGSSARTELPLTPAMFQPGPVPYIKKVIEGEAVEQSSRRLLYDGSIKRRVGNHLFWWGAQRRIRVCAWVNLPDYVDWNYDRVYKTIQEELGWQVPAGQQEHSDCAIHAVTTYVHNRRFPGLEIRRLTLARLVMAGLMSRQEAQVRLQQNPEEECPKQVLEGFLNNIKMSREEFDKCIDLGPRHLQFQPQPQKWWLLARKMKRTIFSMTGIKKPT